MSFLSPAVVVTGGSSGLGAACVRRLASQGAQGVIADLSPPSPELLSEVHAQFVYEQVDVTNELAVQQALQHAAALAPLRAVISCAGVLHAERILKRSGPASLADFRRVIDINLCGTFNVLRLAAEAMRNNEPDADGERGVIVLTSSIAAFEGQLGQAAYAASKGGVAALTLPAARELGRVGIRVVTIAPGVFDTPLMQQASTEVRESLAAQIPFPQRFGKPDEFAALVKHVLENKMLNGVTLRLDGGLRMGTT